MTRLFVALNIPSEIKDNLLNTCRRLAVHPGKFRWEKADKIHLTLKFIGEVEDKLVDSIKTELDFVENYHSFNFSVSKFDFFFRNGEPRILWAGLKTDGPIENLVDEINNRLEKFSIPAERRKFKPHLTMLRIKIYPGEKFIQAFKNYEFDEMNFTAENISLMQSRLFPTGAEYSEIKKYKLK